MLSPPHTARANQPSVKVAVRVRPILPGLDDDLGETCIETEKDIGQELKVTTDVPLGLPHQTATHHFQFDTVFGPQANQFIVYEDIGKPLVDAVMNGHRACLFCYGQTGSGKTFSLLGEEGGRAVLDGMVPKMCEELFCRTASMGTATSVLCSYYEIYDDKVYDLLRDPREEPTPLPVRSTGEGFEVVGQISEQVQSAQELMELVQAATELRTISSNNVHEHSSRSHAFLSLTVQKDDKERKERLKMKELLEESKKKKDGAATSDGEAASSGNPTPEPKRSSLMSDAPTWMSARLLLVDLAGSETYDAKEPHVQINVGLLALGKVLNGLANRRSHVPYRDSSLTKLLQAWLGGTARTSMLACINPASANSYDSLCTLRYARDAKVVVRSKGHEGMSPAGEEADAKGAQGRPLTARSAGEELDSFDTDLTLNRRVEFIESTRVGRLFLRCVGDPADPLVLYLHGHGHDSSYWNPVVLDLANRKAESWERSKAKAKPRAATVVEPTPSTSEFGLLASASSRSPAPTAKRPPSSRPSSAPAKRPPSSRSYSTPMTRPPSSRPASGPPSRGPSPAFHRPPAEASKLATHRDSSPESFADSVEDPTEEGKEAVAKAGADSFPPNRSPSAARRRTRLPPKPSTRTPPTLQRLEPGGGPRPQGSPKRRVAAGDASDALGGSTLRSPKRTGDGAKKGDSGGGVSKGNRPRSPSPNGAAKQKSDLGLKQDPGTALPGFPELTQSLSAALAKRRAEMKNVRCDLCLGLLVYPVHLPCAHVLCGVCVHGSTKYFSECPTCLKPLNGAESIVDKEHDETVRRRIDQADGGRSILCKKLLTAQLARLDAAQRDEADSSRFVLEFGFEPDPTPSDGAPLRPSRSTSADSIGERRRQAPLVPFVRLVQMKSAVVRGAVSVEAQKVLAGCKIEQEEVHIETDKAGAPIPESIKKAFNTFDVDGSGDIDVDELGLALMRLGLEIDEEAQKSMKATGGSLDLIAFWILVKALVAEDTKRNADGSRPKAATAFLSFDSRLGLAPLELKFATAGQARSRRLVVQLPPGYAPAEKGRVNTFDANLAGLPGAITSGWLINEDSGLVREAFGRRSFGRASSAAELNEAYKLLKGEGMDGALGTVADAMLTLMPPALQGKSLSRALEEAGAKVSPLVRAAASSEEVCMLYDELVSEVPPVEEQSPREPQGLFHVALDLPGCGQSEGRLKAFNDDPAQVLADVAKCLGKTHVFALVGAGNGAAAILRALAKQPMLANFVTLCNPTADKAATGSQGAIVLQPTLIVQTEKGTKASIEGSGRSLISALPRGLLVEPVEADFVKITAGRSLRLFEQYSWRAHLPDAGTTKGLPRLSRLAGGLQAWQAAPRGADMIQVRKPRPAPKA